MHTASKVSKYGVFSGPYFLAFRLNRERYSVSLRIQSECEKMRIMKNSVFGHFSRSGSAKANMSRNWYQINFSIRTQFSKESRTTNQTSYARPCSTSSQWIQSLVFKLLFKWACTNPCVQSSSLLDTITLKFYLVSYKHFVCNDGKLLIAIAIVVDLLL